MDIDVEEALEKKLGVAERLRARLGAEEVREAEADSHAGRLPRPCGLTVHTGVGCSFGCLYCYIWDMGFPAKPRPYPLSGLQLAYALAINPAVVVGRRGSLLAFGAVTEPFLPETSERTYEYLSAISSELGNPIQLSTKARLGSGDAARIRSTCRDVSVLVTVITQSFHKTLEPGAPSPEERYETIKNLSKEGIHVSLFLRPILLGIELSEFEEILSQSKRSGVSGVVLGSLRVTEGIIKRLKAAGYPYLDDVLKRIPRRLEGTKQITIKGQDLKRKIMELAGKLDIKIYPSACAANIEAHGLGCASCRLGPCGRVEEIPIIESKDLKRVAPRFGLKAVDLRVEKFKIFMRLEGPALAKRRFKEFVKALTKHEIIIK